MCGWIIMEREIQVIVPTRPSKVYRFKSFMIKQHILHFNKKIKDMLQLTTLDIGYLLA